MMMVIPAMMIAATAIISAIRVSGVLQWTPDNRSMAVIREPTRLTATKKTKLEM
jgi:hypothetical protein